MKPCRICGEVKPLEDFNVHPRMKDGRRSDCKTCQAEYTRNHYQRNKETRNAQAAEWRRKNHARYEAWRKAHYEANKAKEPERQRARWLRHRYGIDLPDYERMLSEQEGRCAICRRSPDSDGKPLYVDHDHDSGRVRGLLCRNCNVLLGCGQDDEEILSRAIQYLRSAQKERMSVAG